jgi:hypothetical protein
VKRAFSLSRLTGKYKKFFQAPPRWLGPLGGGLFGIIGGFPGILAGLIIGYLVQELFRQFRSDKAVIAYFENPGRSVFYEGEPGLAAWCALAVIILSQGMSPENRDRGPGGAIGDEAGRSAAAVFPGKYSPLIESFCRLAESRRGMNPDLLAESLAARRFSRGDLPVLGKALHALASGDAALETAARIRSILDPAYRDFARGVHNAAERLFSIPPEDSPWDLLGLKPGASSEEIKSSFRRLAIQFHPDSLQDFDEKQREEAARVFMKIQSAYREILTILPPRDDSRSTRFS